MVEIGDKTIEIIVFFVEFGSSAKSSGGEVLIFEVMVERLDTSDGGAEFGDIGNVIECSGVISRDSVDWGSEKGERR